MTEHTPDDPGADQASPGDPPPPPPGYVPPPPSDPAPYLLSPPADPPPYFPPPPPDPAAAPPPPPPPPVPDPPAPYPPGPYPPAPGYPPAPPAHPPAPPGYPPPPAYPPPAPAYPPPAPAYPPPPGYGQAPGYAPPGGYEATRGYGPSGGWGPPPYGPPGYPPGAPYGGYQAVPTDAFGRPLAEWWQRVVAALLDGLILGIPVIIAIVIILAATSTTVFDPQSGFATTQTSNTASWLTNVVWVAAALLYFGILDGRGQTVGKLALGIAVRSEATGHPIGVGRGMARRALYILLFAVFILPGLLNALSPLWDRKRQAWHDHAVGSVVVKVR